MNKDLATVGPTFVSQESQGSSKRLAQEKIHVFEETAKSFSNLVKDKKMIESRNSGNPKQDKYRKQTKTLQNTNKQYNPHSDI